MRTHQSESVSCLNNRHYDPTTGVFISVDPLVTLTRQPYIYGNANPITYSDPEGLCPISGPGSAEACRHFAAGEGGARKVSGGTIIPWSPEHPPPFIKEAQDSFVSAGNGLDLTPLTPDPPANPDSVEYAEWLFLYGPRESDMSVVEGLSRLIAPAAPYVAGTVFVVCFVGSGGVCGAVAWGAAAYSVVNNATACASRCENWGDRFETLAKTGLEITTVFLPAPNKFVHPDALNRYVAATGVTDDFAVSVFRNRRIVVSVVSSAGLNGWEVP